MRDSATITQNIADSAGGGVYSYRGDLVGVICAPNANANVFDNSLNDCRARK